MSAGNAEVILTSDRHVLRWAYATMGVAFLVCLLLGIFFPPWGLMAIPLFALPLGAVFSASSCNITARPGVLTVRTDNTELEVSPHEYAGLALKRRRLGPSLVTVRRRNQDDLILARLLRGRTRLFPRPPTEHELMAMDTEIRRVIASPGANAVAP